MKAKIKKKQFLNSKLTCTMMLEFKQSRLILSILRSQCLTEFTQSRNQSTNLKKKILGRQRVGKQNTSFLTQWATTRYPLDL